MQTAWPERTDELRALLKNVRAGAPDIMKAFSAIAQAAAVAKALDTKNTELITSALRSKFGATTALPFMPKRPSIKERPATKSRRPWGW
jgi:hypothetical protein